MRLRSLYYILLIITCFLGAHTVFSQPIENHFTHYETKDGLAEGPIHNITQDNAGFLWLSNENGLCRFDGRAFKTYRYNPADTNSILENAVHNVIIDSKKRLWVISAHWLYLYHPEGEWFEHFGINSLSNDALMYRCVEENGSFIITGHKSLYKFDLTNKKFSFFYHEGFDQPAIDYKKDENGIEWLGAEKGLYRYDPKTKKLSMIDSARSFEKNKENFCITTIILLPDNYLLAASYASGLLLVNRKTNTYEAFTTQQINPEAPLEMISPDYPAFKRIDCTYQLNDSIILCSCSGGLSTFNWRTKTFTYFKPDKSDPATLLESNTRIYSMAKDQEGIIWLGGEYLEKYDYKDYYLKKIPANAGNGKIRPFAPFYDLYKCKDGKFLLGAYAGMSIYDPPTNALTSNNDKKVNDSNYPPDRINYFNEDNRGNIWCYTQRSIRAFNIQNDHPKNIRQYKIPGTITGIYNTTMDSRGRILVATEGKGLAIFDTASKSFIFFNAESKSPSQFTSSSVTAICEDHNGCIWAGTKKGLNKIERDGVTVKQYGLNKTTTTLLPDLWVNSIVEDKQGIIWFATYTKGIGRIDPRNDSVSFISTAQGLPTCYFDRLCIDEEGILWTISKMGIVNLNTRTLQNKLCTEDEGFPAPDDINTIHYSQYDNRLYILTPYDILQLDAKNIHQNNPIPKTNITAITVFDKEKPIYPDKPINLEYNENFVNIQFACLLFHSNRQIKYAYRMDGIDKDWVYCNYKRNATYTNLPPGKYVFNVKAQSPNGVWNEPTQLSVIITPPFWQTWWFYLLEIVALTVLVLWIVRFYTARKLAKQKIEIEKLVAVSNERTRIASDMHDELGAGLTSIRLLSELANQKIDVNGSVKTEIEKIARSSAHLSDNLREIIWAINTRYDVLEDFIIYIRTYAVEYFDNTSIDFQFNRPLIIPELAMSGELRRNIFLCIKEALHNILKHAQATKATLTFEITDDILTTTITDNGIGLDTHRVNKFGNGLNNMKARLEKFDSKLETAVKDGTIIKFSIHII